MTNMTRMAAGIALALTTGLGGGSLATTAQAQDFGISGEIGFGARVRQVYFGADEYGLSPLGRGSLEAFTFGPITSGAPGVARDRTGFGLRGAVRLIPGRSATDYAELAGLDDVDFSLELGLGAQYEAEAYRVFADIRYGVIGHEALVSEVGADVIFRPTNDLEISVGPRLFFGSDSYTSTYFGVTAAEAGMSAFDAFDADGGLLSMGLDLRVQRQLSDDWSIRADLEISEFVNAAADSPITAQGSTTHAIFGVTLARRFSFGF
ncbi:MipA/OmpV family protein [Jannaschia sp. CCS1]|uniref:MipA/OmpV family protein n=1 Tax=Jannaschia sp. (strain CCS1) TaxID=290400 RepID=UPI000053CA66|nr:MipA/OmpV family protein [Jannaschia sp. CCS1]ABD55740.1 MltA-interacting MipA [Jannaschia sp. CCS1]